MANPPEGIKSSTRLTKPIRDTLGMPLWNVIINNMPEVSNISKYGSLMSRTTTFSFCNRVPMKSEV